MVKKVEKYYLCTLIIHKLVNEINFNRYLIKLNNKTIII